MHRESLINGNDDVAGHFPDLVYFLVIRNDRVQMNNQVNIQIPGKIPFDIVNQIMGFKNVFFGVHFRVHGGKIAVRPVVVNHQVMDI